MLLSWFIILLLRKAKRKGEEPAGSGYVINNRILGMVPRKDEYIYSLREELGQTESEIDLCDNNKL